MPTLSKAPLRAIVPAVAAALAMTVAMPAMATVKIGHDATAHPTKVKKAKHSKKTAANTAKADKAS